MAARVDSLHAGARHQALHHFMAEACWSDQEVLRRVCQWIVPKIDPSQDGWWIIADTGFPQKGSHSLGVARQYCGIPGKQDNRQVAVSVLLACQRDGFPVACQLYLPEEVRFATNMQIALAQLQTLLNQGPHATACWPTRATA